MALSPYEVTNHRLTESAFVAGLCGKQEQNIRRTERLDEGCPRAALQFSGQARDELVMRLSPGRISQIKRELGRQIKLRWGSTVLADAVAEPGWLRRDVRCMREKSACRRERQA
ncbi:MAG: hypothetical protein NTV49_14340 [Kiritimatiellaeota bacterium]|nr:hypothetical protein [Kiritimatiellota bacterium]